MTNQFMYQVVECQLLSDSVSRVVLQASHAPHLVYQAGQYIKVLHRDDSVSPLSISCSPVKPGQIELHLSHSLNNEQAQDILKMIGEEARLTLSGPFGSCTLSRFSLTQPIIFLAAGTGFAPVKSLVEALMKLENCPAMHLYWGGTVESELYMLELPQKWVSTIPNFSYTPVLKNSEKTWTGKTGLLQEAVLQDYPELSGFQVYVSGPEKLVYSAFDKFQLNGLSKERFYSDMFNYEY